MKLPHFLTVLLASTISASAASTVLYQTSWDPTPAPAWAAGAINGQNAWLATSASGFQVVANGSAAALGVVTTSGNQFARLLANPSTTGSSNRYAWTDLTAKFAARPPGANPKPKNASGSANTAASASSPSRQASKPEPQEFCMHQATLGSA